MVAEIASVRALAQATLGVNVFVPGNQAEDRRKVMTYGASLADAVGLGVAVGDLVRGDDAWAEQMSSLLADPVPIVGFRLGCPSRHLTGALHRTGSLVRSPSRPPTGHGSPLATAPTAFSCRAARRAPIAVRLPTAAPAARAPAPCPGRRDRSSPPWR